MINSHFSYGINAWGNVNSKVLHPSIMLQKRAIHVINRKQYDSYTDPLFKILKLLDLFEYQSAYSCMTTFITLYQNRL